MLRINPKFAMEWRGMMFYSLGLLLTMGQMVGCDEQLKQNTTTASVDVPMSAIEEEVLGPLRIWHIVFIVCSVLLIAMVAVFCCVEIRVPRSRQEIEENYKKRLLNTRYVRMLEKAPEQLMRAEFPKSEDIAVISSKKNDNSKGKQKQQQNSGAKGWQNVTRSAMSNSKASSGQDDESKSAGQALSMFGNRNIGGRPQPLAINPKDILAIMAQQRKTKAND